MGVMKRGGVGGVKEGSRRERRGAGERGMEEEEEGETVRIKGHFPLLHRCCPKVR